MEAKRLRGPRDPVAHNRRHHWILAAMKQKDQHPLVRAFAENARKEGATVYAGKTFAAARWPDDTIGELRVDRGCKRKNTRT